MNTTVIPIRRLGLGLVAIISLVQAAQAAPTYGPRNTLQVSAPATPCTAPAVTRQLWDGANKRRVEVAFLEPCDIAPQPQPTRWIGPRGTIPVAP
ncbi:hypothetical protein [Solimonas sp. SE-A11]|jgi:hypothetical protein|uniref:hypothetical protein n=1 Tax=Solimonas sp. SE-A11 TaxID=3054954 RepID=UPI00259C8A96|nr:hypothetical protein [Solimonas sp. SE-A11]MDM4771386.1 hypothetical protein [Solimonas sp. SE-A11]